MALLSLCFYAQAKADELAIPEFTSWVTDTTGTLSRSDKASLNQQLDALNQEKGAQIGVLMIPSTQGEAIESFADRAFQAWGLGRKNIDDGVLLIVAKDDRSLRIEVGYGLEGAIPDITAGRIIREQITPHFADGNFSQGVQAGVSSLIALAQGEELPPPVAQDDETDTGMALLLLAFFSLFAPVGLGSLFIGLFVGIFMASFWWGLGGAIAAAIIRLLASPFIKMQKGGGPPGWGGGGGFGGGSSGGFGGGGGGRSGGGGASGRW